MEPGVGGHPQNRAMRGALAGQHRNTFPFLSCQNLKSRRRVYPRNGFRPLPKNLHLRCMHIRDLSNRESLGSRHEAQALRRSARTLQHRECEFLPHGTRQPAPQIRQLGCPGPRRPLQQFRPPRKFSSTAPDPFPSPEKWLHLQNRGKATAARNVRQARSIFIL